MSFSSEIRPETIRGLAAELRLSFWVPRPYREAIGRGFTPRVQPTPALALTIELLVIQTRAKARRRTCCPLPRYAPPIHSPPLITNYHLLFEPSVKTVQRPLTHQ